MSAAVFQYKVASTNTATPFSLTLDATPTTGNIVCVIVVSDNTVTGPGGYTSRASAVSSQGSYIWDKTAGASESATITVTPSSSGTSAMIAIEISGTTGFDSVSTVASTQTLGNQTSRTITSLTTAAGNGDLVIASALLHYFASASPPSSAIWDNGFTALAATIPTTVANANCEAFFATKLLPASTATGTTTPSWTNGATDTMAWHVAYKSAATGALIGMPWYRVT